MKSSQRILAILELESDPELLTERTASIAGAFGCDVHLVLFDPELSPLLGGVMPYIGQEATELRKSIDNAQAAIVEEYADKIRNAGITVTTSTLNLRPLGDHILMLAQDLNPAIIVKTTHYHSTAQRSTLLDSDWQLLRTCPYPLWFVKHTTFPDRPTIAAAVDPLHEDDKPAALDKEIIATAKLVAGKMNGDVRLFHAYQTLTDVGSAAIKATTPAVLDIGEIAERSRASHAEALSKLAAASDIADSKITIQPGRTHVLLPAFARDENVSLLIMGGVSRWGAGRMIVGSTAERVMDHVPCDILILRIGMHPIFDD